MAEGFANVPSPVVGGLVPFTTIDFPGKIAAVVFFQGCPWRCAYCSNPHLFQLREASARDVESWGYVLDLLRRRTKALEAVVFSGGEAVAQAEALIRAIDEIKAIHPYLIGLHTNGCYPDKLEAILPRLDWVGLDIKAPREGGKYDEITKVEGSGEAAWKSLDLVIASGKLFECRTTADPRFLGREDILAIAGELGARGVKTYAVQRFRPPKKDAPDNPSQGDIMQFFTDPAFEAELKRLVPEVIMRW